MSTETRATGVERETHGMSSEGKRPALSAQDVVDKWQAKSSRLKKIAVKAKRKIKKLDEEKRALEEKISELESRLAESSTRSTAAEGSAADSPSATTSSVEQQRRGIARLPTRPPQGPGRMLDCPLWHLLDKELKSETTCCDKEEQGVKEGEEVYLQGRRGVVRFLGGTHFDPAGRWVGVELDEPLGLHGGTVDGHSYFRCAPFHGVLLPWHLCVSSLSRNHHDDGALEGREAVLSSVAEELYECLERLTPRPAAGCVRQSSEIATVSGAIFALDRLKHTAEYIAITVERQYSMVRGSALLKPIGGTGISRGANEGHQQSSNIRAYYCEGCIAIEFPLLSAHPSGDILLRKWSAIPPAVFRSVVLANGKLSSLPLIPITVHLLHGYLLVIPCTAIGERLGNANASEAVTQAMLLPRFTASLGAEVRFVPLARSGERTVRVRPELAARLEVAEQHRRDSKRSTAETDDPVFLDTIRVTRVPKVARLLERLVYAEQIGGEAVSARRASALLHHHGVNMCLVPSVVDRVRDKETRSLLLHVMVARIVKRHIRFEISRKRVNLQAHSSLQFTERVEVPQLFGIVFCPGEAADAFWCDKVWSLLEERFPESTALLQGGNRRDLRTGLSLAKIANFALELLDLQPGKKLQLALSSVHSFRSFVEGGIVSFVNAGVSWTPRAKCMLSKWLEALERPQLGEEAPRDAPASAPERSEAPTRPAQSTGDIEEEEWEHASDLFRFIADYVPVKRDLPTPLRPFPIAMIPAIGVPESGAEVPAPHTSGLQGATVRLFGGQSTY